MIVKVLGAGCAKCAALVKRMESLKKAHQLDFEIEKVTQLNDIMEYGVLMTPGLVINEQVKCGGKIPDDDVIFNWIQEAGNE